MNEKLKFSKEALTKVLLAPCITEKTSRVAGHRQYVFKVLGSSTKPLIREAVEFLFNVKVESVRVNNVKSKAKRMGRIEGTRKGWKKAYVKLAEGEKIEFASA
ncbi:MAG: rplW [Gammaproteobacteria bacterium]|jgi:large subunit ribosomal protein L23|nr:rplW [Gammaproteobacteria bacterium]